MRHLNGTAVADGIDRRGERIRGGGGDVNAEHGGTRDHDHINKTSGYLKAEDKAGVLNAKRSVFGDVRMAPHLDIVFWRIKHASIAVRDFHGPVQIVVQLQILIAIARSRNLIIGHIATLGGIPDRALRADGTDKLKSVATDAATALASGVSSLFGSGKMKSLERKNEDLRDEIAIRDETIEQLQSNIKRMEVEHSRAMMNKDNEHRKALEAKGAEHKEEANTLNSMINTAHRWYPDFANLLRLERLAKQIGLSAMDFAELIKGRVLNFIGRLFSSEHNRWFATDNTPLQILRDNDRRLTLTANRIPLSQWFSEQYDKLRQSIRQPIQPKKSRGMKL